MRCPCISQTNDSVVRCEAEQGHEGLHRWQDPVHPGHLKFWSGSNTDVVGDTRYRHESAKSIAKRMGLVTDGTGRARYVPMDHEVEVL